MAEVELPSLVLDAVAAVVAASRPLLLNRDPAPEEQGVPLSSAITLELLDPGSDGIDLAATRVWVGDQLAFDGALVPPIQPAFAGPQSGLTLEPDLLRLTLDPTVPFASQAQVLMRVVAQVKGGGGFLDETYAFSAEDRTSPRLVAAVALAPKRLRLGFDEPLLLTDPQGFSFLALDLPAVPLAVVDATASGTLLDLEFAREMTPDVRYRVRVTGVTDLHGNPILPPFDEVIFAGFRPRRPRDRRFDLWPMLPRHNRRSDTTGDLARFIACLQEVVDLLLADIDRFPDLFDLERAPEPFLDLILQDLGNPFAFDLDTLSKRRLAAVLVEMVQQKGTAVGVRNAVRFFLGVDVTAITPLAGAALVLGESLLGEDWELGPSDRFARYAFDVRVSRALSEQERRRLRVLVNYLKPAHTHFVDLLEPLPPPVPKHWELGLSDLDDTSLLHG
jgi:phage tail-like protein